MTPFLISAIQTFTFQTRADLEREAHEQLEGLYGWLPDGSFAPPERYLALKLDEACEARARMVQYARDEAEAGFDAAKARRKLVREAAFTWLNRFVAFKRLEARRVLKTLLAPPERANAYLLWLADGHDPMPCACTKPAIRPSTPWAKGRARPPTAASCSGSGASWPDRVKAACLTNKSFAIAHGLAVPEDNSRAEAQRRRGRKRK